MKAIVATALLTATSALAQPCSDLPPVFPSDATIQIDFGPISTFSGITSRPQSAPEAWYLRPHRRRASMRKRALCVPAPEFVPTPPPPPQIPAPIYTPHVLRGVNIIPINIDVFHAWPRPDLPYKNFFPPGDIADLMGYIQYDLQEVNRTFLSELGLMWQVRHVHVWNLAEVPPPPPSPTPGYTDTVGYKAIMDRLEEQYNTGLVPRRLTVLIDGWQNGGGWSGGGPCGGYMQIGLRLDGVDGEKWGHSVHDQNHFVWCHEGAHCLGADHANCHGADGCAAPCNIPPTPYAGSRPCPADVYHYSVMTYCQAGCFGQWSFLLTAPIDNYIEDNLLRLQFTRPDLIACIEHVTDNECTGFAPWLAPHCDNCSCQTPLDTTAYIRQWDWNGNGIGNSCEP